VCFTDDDCRPANGWLAAVVDRFEREGSHASAVAGSTLTGEQHNPCAVASQVVTNHLAISSFVVSDGSLGFAPTSNLACRREVHAELPFDERYPLAAGEDRDWCARLADSGRCLLFEPDAVVWHHQDLDLRGYWRQQQRYGRGAARFHRRHGGRFQQAAFYTGLLRAGFAEGIRAGALVALAQVATASGVLAERWGDRGRR
jgi:cellulose synthase/poly-beta-1,6-N-acetylglucosamine synthase-like glycosyltransferase